MTLFEIARRRFFSISIMENTPSGKLHSIENNTRTNEQLLSSIASNTDSKQFNRDTGTNTPNYAEQMTRDLEKGTSAEKIVHMLMQSK